MSHNQPSPLADPRAFSLTGARAVIAGGSSGVGFETARLFLGAGVSDLLIIGRNAIKGEDAVRRLRADHPAASVRFLSWDLREPATLEDLRREVGQVEIAVSAVNSGAMPTLFHDLAPALIFAQLNDLAMPALLLSSAVLPAMRAQGRGVILLVASDAAKVPTPGEAVIGAAMSAITRFATTLAMEAKRNGIRVNAVTPSLIAETASYDGIMQNAFAAKLFQRAEKAAALGLTSPRDIAETLLFLAGPGAARMTGQVISVNGGISAV